MWSMGLCARCEIRTRWRTWTAMFRPEWRSKRTCKSRSDMPSIAKPIATHPSLQRNDLGLTIRDYEGAMSTLCAGCGHDSVTSALVRSLWELSTPPHMLVKMSGIGCSSKTTAYFVNGAHGFNSAHGRMSPIATGANAANRALVYIGVSGDGDSLSIGLGHLCHAIRRNVKMA